MVYIKTCVTTVSCTAILLVYYSMVTKVYRHLRGQMFLPVSILGKPISCTRVHVTFCKMIDCISRLFDGITFLAFIDKNDFATCIVPTFSIEKPVLYATCLHDYI